MSETREPLSEALRRRADRLHGKSHKCPSPPCPFEEEAAELRAAADEIEKAHEELDAFHVQPTSFGGPFEDMKYQDRPINLAGRIKCLGARPGSLRTGNETP